jgi:7,8-dihydropterin-6-yl-methyl-4-(beta-D-ribofuranosyl)aminobenzene 5'-phosphate synthase
MSYRINPLLWPVLGLASPLLLPLMAARHYKFRNNISRARELNRKRLEHAQHLELPPVDQLELTILVEQNCSPGFKGESGISYLLTTDRGSLLFDISYGDCGAALVDNATSLKFDIARTDGLAISHLHPDHMGGTQAMKNRMVKFPQALGNPGGKPCFLPDRAEAEGFTTKLITEPGQLVAGIGTTGPLARSLFFTGLTEEQALLVNVKDKGLVIITGCGHMTIPLLLKMVSKLTDLPLYALIGGMHLPLTASRAVVAGVQIQMLAGTGLPPWRKIEQDTLTETVAAINSANPSWVGLSAHDSCDYALESLQTQLKAETELLEAGKTYNI